MIGYWIPRASIWRRAIFVALVSLLFSVPAYAAVTPYVSDANTVLLDHFDGATSASILAYTNADAACGSTLPSATPNSAYVAGPGGLSQALSLNPPAGQAAGLAATYLQYPGGQLLSQANGTIEFWTYLASYGTGLALVDQGPYYGSCAGWTFGMGVDATGQLSVGAWDAFSLNSGTNTVPLNTWTHVAATWGSSGAKLYINGVQVGSDANTGMPASGYGGSVRIRLGNYAGSGNQIDELRISNVQRTSFNSIAPASVTPALALLSNHSALTEPLALETDGTNLYIANGNNVLSMPIGGGAVSTLFANATPRSIYGMTRIGTNLYWIDPQGDLPSTSTAIWRGATSGGAVTNVYLGSTTGEPIIDGSGLSTDGTLLFAADMVQGRVVSMNADGSGITTLGSRYGGYFDTAHLNAVAHSGGVLYIADPGKAGTIEPQVVAIPKTGGSFTALHVGAPFVSPVSIAVGNGMVYVADPGANNTIWKLPLTGGTPTALISGAPFVEIWSIVFYNNALYISDTGNVAPTDGPGAIYRLDLGGAAPAPVAYWTFDNDTANDSVGTHHGTIAGSGVTFTTGKVGRAISFSSGSSWVKIPSFNLPYLTVSVWVNSAKSGYYTSMVTKNYYATGWSPPYATWGLWFSENTARPGTTSTGTEDQSRWNIASPDAMPMNEWFHLAATYDGATVKVYVNGVEKASAAAATPGRLPDTLGDIYIGTPEFSNHSFIGLMDEVAIWNQALSAAAIAQQYQSSLNGQGYLATDNAAPTTPAGLSATAASSSQIDLSWTASSDNVGVTQYRIYRDGALLTSLSGTPPAASHNDTGLAASTSYSYTVAACDAAGNCSEQSLAAATSTLAPPATVPGAPTIGTATGANASASVSFTAPTNTGGAAISGYTVTSNPGNITATGTASPISVTGLTNGTAYTFTVTATNSVGAGAASAASNSVTPATVPGAPTGITAVAANASATVSFAAPSSNGGAAITGYTVTSNPGNITATGSASPITVSGLTNGTAYTFTVTAGNSAGSSAASAASNSVTPATVPGAPTGVSATAGDASATVSFAAPSSNGGAAISSYAVTSSPSGFTASAPASPITVSGLANGSAYTFTVTATNSAGTGAASVASNSVTPTAPSTSTSTSSTTSTTTTSSTAATTTSTASTTTTTLPGFNFTPGWNLVGNGVEAVLNVASVFADPDKVTTVWKWVISGTTSGVAYPGWAFYAPSLPSGGQAYAASKGYDLLTTVKAGEGFWVNANAAFSAPLPAGTAIKSSSFLPGTGAHALPEGWNLIATGDRPTADSFNATLTSATSPPPSPGSIAVNLTTLWAWDALYQRWYFWAPSLVNSGGLANYITTKGYLNFNTMPNTPVGKFAPTTGFWVNMPAP